MSTSADARLGTWSSPPTLSFGRFFTGGAALWTAAFVLVVALHVGIAAYFMMPSKDTLDGNPSDVISVELTPDASTANDKPDDVAGPKVLESNNPTSEQTLAEDPDPPAPDSPPPTEAKRKPDTATEELTAPQAPDAKAVLPPEEKPTDRPPDPKPLVEKMPDVKEDMVERQTAPSQASTGSAAVLGGGKRPSAAMQASWKGEIGTLLVHNRRYPVEARNKGWQGTARVRVTLDANGHVTGRELLKSSGRSLLDGEALALVQRSDPFPKPPEGMATPIVLTVPVNFSIH